MNVAEVNAANAPVVRTDADALAGVTLAKDAAAAAKKARDDARANLAALAKAAKDAKAAATAAAAAAPKPATARSFVRDLDREILTAAGQIVKNATIPAELRTEVEQLISNQLHHLASPKVDGWNVDGLPIPQRSEWMI
jgi:hypothetical protein